MGINDLRLSPELVAALYPEILVTGRDEVPLYTFLGKNLRSLCVLVSSANSEFLPEEQLVFLQKILAACKYDLVDIALINIHRQPLEMERIKSQFSPRIVFFWGIPPVIPGLQRPLEDMAVSTWQDITVLPVVQSKLMSRENPEGLTLKRILWSSLKKIFNL